MLACTLLLFRSEEITKQIVILCDKKFESYFQSIFVYKINVLLLHQMTQSLEGKKSIGEQCLKKNSNILIFA